MTEENERTELLNQLNGILHNHQTIGADFTPQVADAMLRAGREIVRLERKVMMLERWNNGLRSMLHQMQTDRNHQT